MALQLLVCIQMESRILFPSLIILSIIITLALLYSVKMVILVTLIGIGIGTLLIPFVNWMRNRVHIPAGITAFFVILILVAIVGGVGYSVYYIGANQLGKVADSIPQAYHTVRSWLTHHAGLANVGTKGQEGLTVSSALQKVLGTVFQGARLGLEVGAGLFFVISVALYVAVDPGRSLRGFLTLFPAYLRPRLMELMCESAQTLRQWFLSHLIIVAAVGAAYAFGLWLLGNPYWPLFGFLAAVLEFIPYIGPFVIAISASAVTVSNGNFMGVIWVALLSLAIQELEGHVLIPIVMKDRINLPPVQLITLAIIMGFWFGILGVFVAPPFLAVLRNVYLKTYVKWMDERKLPFSQSGADTGVSRAS